MKRALSIFLLFPLVFALFLVSCANGETPDQPADDGKTITLNVYNWGEYISDGAEDTYDTNAEFEKYYYEKTGRKVKVLYSTYASNEDMYSKIANNAGTYDVIVPSDYMIQRMAAEGLLYAFDPANTVENYEYIEEEFKGLYYDPDNLYSVPYSCGVTAVIYNETMVDEEDVADESWGLLWNPKYKGKILQFNNPRDGFGTAQYYLNLDVNATDPDVWQKTYEKMLEQKPLVQGYVADEIFNKMTSESAAIGAYYLGDYITMCDENENLNYYVPTEGTNVFVDAMCIPVNAKHKDLAIEYINFMLSEEAAVANAVYIGYASPNSLVKNSEDYLEEMGEEAYEILYGTSMEELNKNYGYDPYYHSFSPEIQNLTNTLWESLMTESTIEPWVHVVSALIVAGALGCGIFFAIRKRKRAAHYLKASKK